MTNLVQLDGVTRRFGDDRRPRRCQPRHRLRPDRRPARPERRRQDHAAVAHPGAAAAELWNGEAARRQPVRLPHARRSRQHPAGDRPAGDAKGRRGDRLCRRPLREPGGESRLAEEFGLADLLRRQTGALSGGQKRRLSVALAFVGRPQLVLLDEPTTGLDVDGRRTLWEAVRRQHQAGATVVLTSHYLEEIEALAERVIVIDHGRVLVDDDLTTVVGQVGLRMLRLSTPVPDAISALDEVAETRAEDDGSHTFFVRDADQAVVALVNSGIPFSGLTVRGATLEEAFLTLTSHPSNALEDAR